MWIGTHNGLNLFDGNRIQNFLHNPQNSSSIAGTFITSILEDSTQQIWVGNENGMDRFNPSSFSFTHFGVDRDSGKENTYCVILGLIRADELWFLDTKTKTVRSLNPKTGVTSFIAGFNASHALLYKNANSQAIHTWSAYDKGTIHQVYKENKLVKEESFFNGKGKTGWQPELVIIHVLQQNDSTVWLAANKGLVKLNPLSGKYQIFDSWQGKTVRELRYSALGADGFLWTGSGPDGIYVFDTRTNQFINNFKNDEFDPLSVCSDNIVSLLIDKAGILWCGSYGSGLSYTHSRSNFFAAHISKKETASWRGNNHITLLGDDLQGNLWCTFQNLIGIGLLDGNFKIRQYRTPRFENGAVYNQPIYKLLFETKDEAWMATNQGLFLYNVKTNIIRPIPYELLSKEVQGSIWIKDIIRLLDGSVLFSTYDGLYHMTTTTGNPEINPVLFLNPGTYNGFGKLAQDKQGLVYVKSLADFIYILRYIPRSNSLELIRSLDFMPEVNQFYNYDRDSLLYIASDDGLYWIRTNTLDLQKEKLNEQIPFINVSSFFRQENKLWLFGEKGLYCYDKMKNESQTYTLEDGLPSDEFSQAALVYENAGRCVAGTSNGLVSFTPSEVQFLSNSPGIRITSFYINDKPDTLHTNPDDLKSIKLASRQNTFSFNFSPIAYFHPGECNFEYKLENYDENWIRSGATSYTRYSKTPPGKYLFRLRVLDNQGRASPNEKTLEIEIAKSFWQSNFFKLSMLAVILFAGWIFLKWYSNEKMKKQKREMEKLQAIEKERTRIATDMHDDLGAGLSRIRFLSEMIGLKKQKQESFDDDISKIREYSHEMIDKMGEIVWALNEKNDTLSDLLAYTRAYAVEYLMQNGIACTVQAPDHFPSTFVSGEFRRNIYLTVKEALHNIVKHAQASSVIIKMQVDRQLQVEIRDNGTGFDPGRVRSFSNGLSNMEARIKNINGKFGIEIGSGTTVKIQVPLAV
jgi:signal transduction histidine kinase/ligand-binding sensor domain-containing protein